MWVTPSSPSRIRVRSSSMCSGPRPSNRRRPRPNSTGMTWSSSSSRTPAASASCAVPAPWTSTFLPPARWRTWHLLFWASGRWHRYSLHAVESSGSTEGRSASELIDERIAELGDWRGVTLSRMRELIKEADPDVVEEWKWAKATSPGTPVWSHDGIICTGESYASKVKLTFAKGASLDDPTKLFNSSLEGKVRRAIDIHEGEEVDADAFKALVRAAVALNASGGKARPARA